MVKSHWTNHGTRPKRARLTDRRRRALELRMKGLTFSDIARQVGYASPSGAYEAVRAALNSDAGVANDEFRKLHLARLEALLKAVWDTASRGELGAIDRALRVLDWEAKLSGLDLPRQPEEPPEELPGKVYINFPMDDI